MGERIAVTGANGFVGRHLIVHAAARRFEVVGVVRSEEGARVVREAGGVPAKIDALETDALARAFAGARAVVHLAQVGSERGSATYEAINVQGTKAVIAAATAAGVPQVVYFSGLGVARYGMAPRTTNPYFLSKLSAEVAFFRSDRAAVVFRPSYIVGPGNAFVPAILREMVTGEVERPGDGSFRLQPIFVRDAAEAVLAAIQRPASRGRDGRPRPSVFDLVGPEVVTYQQLLDRVAGVARAQGRTLDFRVREVTIAEIDRQAGAGGYRGMLPDEVDCLLCDEVSDPAPLEALLGRFLTPLDDTLAAARAWKD
jgi:nucleoside-diphosphate-sugar epimerase